MFPKEANTRKDINNPCNQPSFPLIGFVVLCLFISFKKEQAVNSQS